jgi:radical SAM-linked protein
MNFTINVGIFLPKPHTPYQWIKQIDSESAWEKLEFIIAKLKPFGHKVSVSDPVISKIEGLLSRGDEQAGLLCEKAFLSGSRLDPWREYIKKDTWIELLEANSVMINNFLIPDFPWKVIDSCVSQNYLKDELNKSNKCERSVPCDINCKSLCGVCGLKNTVVKNQSKTLQELSLPDDKDQNNVNRNNYQVNKQTRDPSIYRLLFSFSKKGGAVFHGHLSLIEIFSMAFTRSEIPVIYTQGFNPIAKIEFASPLACGITSLHEIACVDFSTDNSISAANFIERVNRSIHDGIQIEQAEGFYIAGGMKKHSLSSLLWGFAYNSEPDIDFVKTAEDKQYKEKRCSKKSDIFHLQKLEVLAKNITGSGAEYISYFEAYRYLYNSRQNVRYEQ